MLIMSNGAGMRTTEKTQETKNSKQTSAKKEKPAPEQRDASAEAVDIDGWAPEGGGWEEDRGPVMFFSPEEMATFQGIILERTESRRYPETYNLRIKLTADCNHARAKVGEGNTPEDYEDVVAEPGDIIIVRETALMRQAWEAYAVGTREVAALFIDKQPGDRGDFWNIKTHSRAVNSSGNASRSRRPPAEQSVGRAGGSPSRDASEPPPHSDNDIPF
jgi:hypothetical protein